MKIQSIIYKFLVVYSFITFIAFLNPLQGQETASLQQADSLFSEQRYTQANKVYSEILETGKASPAMLLRMAYIQESLGNIPRTLYLLNLYYEETSHRGVLEKIEKLAEANELKGYEYSDVEYFKGFLRQYHQVVGIGLLVLAGLIFLTILYRKVRLQQRPVWSGVALVVLLAGAYYLVNVPVDDKKGIVMKDYVQLMSGPSAGASVVETIGRGHRLKILGREDVWVRVEWNNRIMYVKENSLSQV